ncbi:PorP/SprF family type IX secretion system membrane protein [Flavilitoribacter nigricans]|nr:PorP/SprF family type IX secretion system membrane protein [Flavilitoribacter nigricans]
MLENSTILTKRSFYWGVWMLICLLYSTQSSAQDPRFSQFYANPLQLNPAMIGAFEGQFRFTANYRDLYGSILANKPYRTMTAGIEIKSPVARRDFATFAISAMRDRAGESNFQRTRLNIGGSFMKQLDGGRFGRNGQFLVVGAQLGAGQRSYNWNDLWFTEQFDANTASVNYGADSGEAFERASTNIFLDFNAGLLWYALFDENMSVYLGGSMHHLNNPSISLLDNPMEKLPTKYVIHGGAELPFNDNLSFMPAVAFLSQGTSMSTTVGGNFRYRNRDWKELAIRAGLWGHVANKLDSGVGIDALIFTTILEMERWNLGISYDVTTSILSVANNSRGAFELSLIYVHPGGSRQYRVECPNF